MKFISFGKINRKFLIPIIGGILALVFIFLIRNNHKLEILSKNAFIMNVYNNLGMIFAIIPYIILKKRTRKINVNPNELKEKSKLNIELIHSNIFGEININKYIYIFISTIFDFFQVLLNNVFCANCVYNLWIFDIVFISLFSYFLLKTKLYNHQYFSIIIIIILGLVLNIFEYLKLNNVEDKIDIFEISMKFLTEICMSLSTVIFKLSIEKYYANPYEICIWAGSIELFLNIIIILIMNLSRLTFAGSHYPEDFLNYFDNYDLNDFFLFFLKIVYGCFYNVVFFFNM